jgi:23S rRNA pseudouridine1911/1915/1917 synthase
MKKIDFYIVDKTSAGMTLRDYLSHRLHFSRRSIISLKKSGGAFINGEISHMNVVLQESDKIEISFEDSESENILPEQMELDIVFEDEHIIVLNKEYGMPVHPTRRHIMGTLANGLAYYWMDREEQIKIRPINRLDKDTSGLVVFAKNAHIQHLLSFYVGKEEFKKEYTAIVQGSLLNRSGTIDLQIARETEYGMKRIVREDGDRAVTHYKVIAEMKGFSVVNITLETGRTHQIRVHMAHIGHPLLGDELYGGSTKLIGRQALHAEKITMLQPLSKKWHIFSTPVPRDMQRIITECF